MILPTTPTICRIVCTVWISLFLLSPVALGQVSDNQYGTVDFPISCHEEAKKPFESGLALLHHTMYEQATIAFERAADEDPTCGIAYWGIAMAQLHPLWAPPTETEFKRGQAAIEQAKTLGARTEREQKYINAIVIYYSTAADTDHQTGVQTWEAAQKNLHDTFPKDVDAAAFYALSHIATAPPDDDTFTHQHRAGTLLENRLEVAPRHPGLFHYLIHAYDNPALAEQAVEVARGYDKLAPEVPHALHMPTHIFVRLGLWRDVIDWNRRSADAAPRQSPEDYTSLHHVHALDYTIYAYLQRGQDQKAQEILEEILEVDTYQPHPASAYGLAAAQARYVLERNKWNTAAGLPLRVHETYPWDKFPEHEAITYWARGLGAAKANDVSAARAALKKLKDLHNRTLAKEEDYWATLVHVRRITVLAWIAHAEGDNNRALRLMPSATDLEDSVDKQPITPGAVLPARELLGDLLFTLERPEKTIEAYQAALTISPNRFRSLYGSGRAAELASQPAVAKRFYAKLLEICVPAEHERPAVQHARAFLAEN